MFTIYDGSTEFKQWDLGQKVTEPGLVAGDKVIFLNGNGTCYPVTAYEENGVVVADVNDKLLRKTANILVYRSGHDETRTVFNVIERERPECYAIDDGYCIEWSGASGYEDEIDLSSLYGVKLYKASDIILTKAQLKEAVVKYGNYNSATGMIEFNIHMLGVIDLKGVVVALDINDKIVDGNLMPFIVSGKRGTYNVEGAEIYVPSDGTYFLDMNHDYVHFLFKPAQE